MTRSIDAIIAELLTLDPALKEHEAALKPLVKALLEADPAREPDATFLADLRSRLQQRAAVLSSSSSSSPSSSMSKFFYALTGAVAAVIIAVPAATYVAKHGGFAPSGSKESLFTYKVTPASPEAFGSLSQVQPAMGMGGGGRDQSGGGGGGGDEAAIMASDATNEANAMDEKMMIYPPGEMTMYEYVYEGELPALPGDTVDVLKRQNRFPNVPLSLIADRFDLGSIDIDSFGDAKLEYANFIEDKDFGYAINLGLRDGSVSINQNWLRWPQSKCQTEACWKAEQVKISEIPADAELIRIAKEFVDDRGIDVSRYGEPFVDGAWKIEYERMTDKSMAWVPETQRVIFPLLIEGKEVFEQYGEKAGISVGVHVKHKRVSDVWGVMDQTYASSAYDAVKDPQAIKDFLSSFERWDPAATMPAGVKTKTVRVTLGTPTYALSRHYNYTEGSEIVYRKAVVVPLAQELLQQNQPQPMPLMEKIAE